MDTLTVVHHELTLFKTLSSNAFILLIRHNAVDVSYLER